MPVEGRLRSALTEMAAEVRPDVEQRLVEVHRRRTRRQLVLGSSAVAAVASVLLGIALLVPQQPVDPRPAAPPKEQAAVDETVPVARYVREVTAGELEAYGFSRAETRWLLGGGQEGRAELRLRGPQSRQEVAWHWQLAFIDGDGTRRVRDGGSFRYDDPGELTLVSMWTECLGCTAHYTWRLEARQLTLETTPDTQVYSTVQVLRAAEWERWRH